MILVLWISRAGTIHNFLQCIVHLKEIKRKVVLNALQLEYGFGLDSLHSC